MFFHSTLDVGRSMLDVHSFSANLPQSIRRKNNLALMREQLHPPLLKSQVIETAGLQKKVENGCSRIETFYIANYMPPETRPLCLKNEAGERV